MVKKRPKKARNQKFLDEIIQRIKRLREEKGISQEIFYGDTGINIGRIERGLRDFNMTTLHSICEYFEISPEDFFKGLKKNI